VSGWLYPVPDVTDCQRCRRDSCEGACRALVSVTFTEEDAAEDVREIFGDWTETAR